MSLTSFTIIVKTWEAVDSPNGRGGELEHLRLVAKS